MTKRDERITITIDGVRVSATPEQTVLEAAEAAGVYIPHLCHRPGLEPYGGCRVCTVKVSGRGCAACTQPVADGMVVESETPELIEQRRMVIEMLFIEGNHFCMFCEKSGNCELQALAYRFGITAPRFELRFPQRDVDATHPDILLDHNRCILCAACVRASRDLDGKHVFQFVERGAERRIGVNAKARLADTGIDATDKALDVCPVGALLRKREGFREPVGERRFDLGPITTPPPPEENREGATGGPIVTAEKPRIATVSLAGCFGCHMSLLDIDERILELAEIVAFDRSPLVDFKGFDGRRCAVGLVEGGCANEENVRVLRDFRKHCDVLVSLGVCATAGGVPAMRNLVPVDECLDEAFRDGPSVVNPDGIMPDDPELPRLLDKVRPCHEVVKIDYHLPGCPPSADAIWLALTALLSGASGEMPYELLKYD